VLIIIFEAISTCSMSEGNGDPGREGGGSNADRLFFSSDLEAQHAVCLKSEAQVCCLRVPYHCQSLGEMRAKTRPARVAHVPASESCTELLPYPFESFNT